MSTTSDASTVPDSDTISGEDIFDEQLFFILKQFMISKSGKNVADCFEEVGERLRDLYKLLAEYQAQKTTKTTSTEP
jgi:hypothetical protein